jgi:hypothetical protein
MGISAVKTTAEVQREREMKAYTRHFLRVIRYALKGIIIKENTPISSRFPIRFPTPPIMLKSSETAFKNSEIIKYPAGIIAESTKNKTSFSLSLIKSPERKYIKRTREEYIKMVPSTCPEFAKVEQTHTKKKDMKNKLPFSISKCLLEVMFFTAATIKTTATKAAKK